MKNKFKKIIIIASIVVISIIFILLKSSKFVSEDININDSQNIITYIKNSIENEYMSEEDIEIINQYLSEKNKDSEYYFIKGYLDYINGDFTQAIENLNLASENISNSDEPFIKVYTYILLNESLLSENQYDFLIENCKIALKYISEEKDYKNDSNLLWRVISVLLNNEEQIKDSIDLFNDYLNKTKGLTDEGIVKITANIGHLYSLIYKYSDAMYNYLDAINIIDNNPSIPNNDYYRVKLLTFIGDINFSLNEYENAINYYDSALNITLNDKNEDALSKSFTIINKCQAYIELENYEGAIKLVDELNDLIPYLDYDVKDDVEILMNNIVALTNIYQKNFEEAEKQLVNAMKLLDEDVVEFSLYKEVFINLTYAKFYKEQKLYDKALPIYDYVLNESINKGIGLEEAVYRDISDIYKDQEDFNNYIKYNELYIKQQEDSNRILKKDYMEYTENLYESNLLKEKENSYKLNLSIMFFSLLILSIIILNKTMSVKKLRYLNFTDSMTGLYNRRYLDYYMNKNNKKLMEKVLSIIIIDIDFFKKYNDNYGHIEGDKVIKEVSNILKSSVRKSDVSIRYGGEEMVVILPEVPDNNIEAIAKKIQNNLKNKKIEHKYSDVDEFLTISLGIYTTKFVGQDIYKLINKADEALYNAKKNGRNRYDVIYD